jgi:hypothetical protein
MISSCLNRKKIMKKIVLTLLILSTGSLLRAQDIKNTSLINQDLPANASKLNFGFSINPGLSVGNGGSNFVLGGELTVYKSLTPNLEATFSAGITEFFYNLKDIQNDILIPIKSGIRYYITKQVYVGAQAGVAISTTDGGAYFIYSPTIGFKMSKQFDIGLKYDHFSNEPSVLGLNFTYRIR